MSPNSVSAIGNHRPPEEMAQRTLRGEAFSVELGLSPAATQQIEQERLVGAIAQRIRHTLNLPDLVTIAAQELGQLLLADRVEIVRYLPEQHLWQHLAEYRRDCTSPSFMGRVISDQDNPLAERLKRFEVVHIDHAALLDDPINQEFAQAAPGSWLLIPLKIDNQLWGSLSLLQQKSGSWHIGQVGLIQAAAAQLEIAIEHSQLYQQVQQLNEALENTVRQRTEELSQALASESVLKRITDKVRDSLDETHILETVVEELVNLLGLNYCSTGLYDSTGKFCTVAYDHAETLPSAQGKIIDMTVHYPDIQDQLLCCRHVQFCLLSQEAYTSLAQQTILACPIFDNQGVLGDLWLFRPVGHIFNELEVRLVQQVTNQCAIAIRQARLYQASQHQVENLEHLNQLKDSFLSTVSHELRTPISSIKMAIQMLTLALGREGLLPDPNKPSLSSNKIAHYLKILNDECNREIGLITDLLDLQQLEAGTHHLTLQPIEVESYLQRIARPFQAQAASQGQFLQIDIAPNLPPLISDAQSLERILVELLTNACKYTPTGKKIELSAQSAVIHLGSVSNQGSNISDSSSTQPTPAAFLIRVMNTGIQIPSDQIGRVFDKFYRIPDSDPHRYGGTGLGLALVKKLTSRIGGKVFVESNEDITSFTLELPSSLRREDSEV